MEKKFETIIESYLNGNISWVKEQVKKLRINDRKELYKLFISLYPTRQDSNFFLDLI